MEAEALSYWIKFAVIAVGTLIAVAAAVRRSRTRAARHDRAIGIIGVLGVTAAVVFIRPAFGYVVPAVAAVVGVALGFAIGRVRPLAAWLMALATVFLLVMALFGQGKAAAVGIAAYAFGVSIVLGQGIRGPATLERTPPVGAGSGTAAAGADPTA